MKFICLAVFLSLNCLAGKRSPDTFSRKEPSLKRGCPNQEEDRSHDADVEDASCREPLDILLENCLATLMNQEFVLENLIIENRALQNPLPGSRYSLYLSFSLKELDPLDNSFRASLKAVPYNNKEFAAAMMYKAHRTNVATHAEFLVKFFLDHQSRSLRLIFSEPIYFSMLDETARPPVVEILNDASYLNPLNHGLVINFRKDRLPLIYALELRHPWFKNRFFKPIRP